MLIRKKTVVTAIALGAAGLAAAAPALAAAPAGSTTRISQDTTDYVRNQFGDAPALSANGKVATYLVNRTDGDPNGGWSELHVRDLAAGTNIIADAAPDGSHGNGFSEYAGLSQTGRWLVFASSSSNLVAGDTNGASDVFVRDLKKNVTTRVSVDNAGAQLNVYSDDPSISADGGFVAFTSYEPNSVPGGPSVLQVYVRDLVKGTNKLVSARPDGTPTQTWDAPGSVRPFYTAVSRDGRYVAFTSPSTDLVQNEDKNGRYDVFLRDTVAGTTMLVSAANDGKPADSDSHVSSISADGQLVAFTSFASNINNATGEQVYVRGINAKKTELISKPKDQRASGNSNMARLSTSGRYVLFVSDSADLGAPAGTTQLFLRDRKEDTTTLVSVNLAGAPSQGSVTGAGISTDGSAIVFGSTADDLVDGDSGGTFDAFVRKLG